MGDLGEQKARKKFGLNKYPRDETRWYGSVLWLLSVWGVWERVVIVFGLALLFATPKIPFFAL